MSKTQKVRDYLIEHPNATGEEVANKFKISKSYVYVIRSQMKKALTVNVSASSDKQVKPKRGRPRKQAVTLLDLHDLSAELQAINEANEINKANEALDMVNNPPHYTDGGIQTIDFIESKGLGYHLGNAVKYISRAGKKGTNQGLEDLRKARWYLDRAIEKNEFANSTI